MRISKKRTIFAANKNRVTNNLKHRDNEKSYKCIYCNVICDFGRGANNSGLFIKQPIIYNLGALFTRNYSNGKPDII